ncbi:hypothetical protein J2Y86_000128 [Pseudomonas migulae]|nr:hypothetical protein [Pseudomonas migulae]
MPAMAVFQATWVLRVYISIPAVTAANGFALTASYLEERQVTKRPAPLTYGGSLVLAIPSLRSCSVGPPPSAIHGRGRLPRHPCRGAHCAEPALGLPTGQIKIKNKARRPDSRPEVRQDHRGEHQCHARQQSTVGAGLLAKAASQTTCSCGCTRNPVGAGLPAIDVQTPHSFRQHTSSLTTIAGKPAPTGECIHLKNQVGR